MRKSIYKSDSKEIVIFFILLISTLLLKKTLPDILFHGFLLLTLLLFYRSKENWLYLLYAFVVTFNVGGIIGFHGYQIINYGNIIIPYYEMFSLVAFIKSINKKKQRFIIIRNNFIVWIIYGAFLLIYGYLFFGIEAFSGHSGLRYFWYLKALIITLLFFISINKLLTYNDIIKFSKVIFILVFVNLIGQIYYLLFGSPIFVSIIGVTGGESTFLHTLGEDVTTNGYTMRPEFGSNIRFIALFLSMYFYNIKNVSFKKTYLTIVIMTILLSTFITATRGWILAFSLMIILTITFSKEGYKFIKPIVVGVLITLLLIFYYAPLRIQMFNAYKRFMTVELLTEGDITAGGTNVRLTDRSAPVMDIFYEHPIFGVGISGFGMKTSDHHVGNQTILMGEGVIGMLIFLAFIFMFIYQVYLYNNIIKRTDKHHYGTLNIIIFSFLGLLLIHSSSQGLFGWLVYAVRPEKILFISLLFTIYNKVIIQKLEIYGIRY